MHVETTRSNHLIIYLFYLSTTNDKQNFGLPPGDGRHCCLSCDCQLPGVAGLFDAAQLSLVCMLGWGISGVGIRRIRSTLVYVIVAFGPSSNNSLLWHVHR